MSAECKLNELNLELPPAPKPAGVYKPIVISGDMAYVSGHGPVQADGSLMSGRVGEDVDGQGGYDAARQTGLAILATLRTNLGSLDRVRRVVKVLGMVNSEPDWVDTPLVINGCSDLLVELYGDRGRHGRSAVGMATLPFAIPVEVEMVVEVAT